MRPEHQEVIESYQDVFAEGAYFEDLRDRANRYLGITDLSIRELAELLKTKNEVGQYYIDSVRALFLGKISKEEFAGINHEITLEILFRWYENLYGIELSRFYSTRTKIFFDKYHGAFDDTTRRELLNHRDEIQRL